MEICKSSLNTDGLLDTYSKLWPKYHMKEVIQQFVPDKHR